MRITTQHGVVSLSRDSGDRTIEHLARLWQLPIVRHGSGGFGLTFQVGRREMWCTQYVLPTQISADIPAILSDLVGGIRETLVKMNGVGQRGFLLPCAFMRPHGAGTDGAAAQNDTDDETTLGIAVFSSDQPRVGGDVNLPAPLRDRFIRIFSTSATGALLPAFERIERVPRLSVGMMKLEMALILGEPLLLADTDSSGQLETAVEANMELWAGNGVRHIAWAPAVPRSLSDTDMRALGEVNQTREERPPSGDTVVGDDQRLNPIDPVSELTELEEAARQFEASDRAFDLTKTAVAAVPIAVPITQNLPDPADSADPAMGRSTQPLFALRAGVAQASRQDDATADPVQILAAVRLNPFSRLVRVDPDAVHAELIAAAFEVCVRVGRLDVIPAAFGPATAESIAMGGVTGVQLLLRHSATETCAVAVRAGTGLDVRELRALAPVMGAGCSHLAAVSLADVPSDAAAGPWQQISIDAMVPMIDVAAAHSDHPDFFRAHGRFIGASRQLWQAVGDAAAADGRLWQPLLSDAELQQWAERLLAIDLLDYMDARLERQWPRLDRGPLAPPQPVDERALCMQLEPGSSALTVAIVSPDLNFACGVRLRQRRLTLFIEPLTTAQYGRSAIPSATPSQAQADALIARICGVVEPEKAPFTPRDGATSRHVSLAVFDWFDGVSRLAAADLAVETVWLMWQHFDSIRAQP